VATAIVKQIDRQRAAKIQEIQGQRPEDAESYSVDEALKDVWLYHENCSFAVAVSQLASDDKRAASAEELKQRIAATRTELDANVKAAANLTGAAKANMQAAIENQTRIIKSLSLQLGMTQNVPISSPPKAKEPPADAAPPPKSANP